MEKGSKFLAFAFPVNNEPDAQACLQLLKKKHPKARHFCTAIRLGQDVSIERSNDDGEPAGSAGKPILGQLKKEHLTNILIVVVRYFGGTKLGIPGLIEAYKSSTADALSKALIIRKTVYSVFEIRMRYEMYPAFKNHILQAGLPLIEEHFHEMAEFKIGFKKSGSHLELLSLLKAFSQRDFNNLEDYAQHLEITIDPLEEEYIL
jgi:uncharacterized YigZ family protein